MKRVFIGLLSIALLLVNPALHAGFADAQKDVVKEIVQTKFEVHKGSEFVLPSKVTIKLRNGKSEIVDVSWTKYSNIAKDIGKYTYTCLVTKYGEKEKFIVTVINKSVPDEQSISVNEAVKKNNATMKEFILKKCASEGTVTPVFPRWSETLTSYMTVNSDSTISIIEAKGDISIQTYNKEHKLIAKNHIKYELPLFGGFYSGIKYNYIAFGQKNNEQNNKKEVIRIVKYDKSFKRINSVSITGGESCTTVPFEAACGRMAEKGNTLVFHTSHLRYKTEDGLIHQSQLTIVLNTASMKVINHIGEFQDNHVSHSFDQYVIFDGDTHVLLDHGDAYPRAIVLHKQSKSKYTAVDLFEIPGKIGANCTGVSIGGFEASAGNYLVALNSIDHKLVKDYTSYEMVGLTVDQRDPIICVLPKNGKSSADVRQVKLSNYIGSNKIASIPQLVKISNDKFMVLWQEFQADNYKIGDLKYLLIDGNGNALSEIKMKSGIILSRSKPIVIDKEIVWYINRNATKIFYSIPLN